MCVDAIECSAATPATQHVISQSVSNYIFCVKYGSVLDVDTSVASTKLLPNIYDIYIYMVYICRNTIKYINVYYMRWLAGHRSKEMHLFARCVRGHKTWSTDFNMDGHRWACIICPCADHAPCPCRVFHLTRLYVQMERFECTLLIHPAPQPMGG